MTSSDRVPSGGNDRSSIAIRMTRYVGFTLLVLLLHTANAAADDPPVAFMRNLLSGAIEVLNHNVPRVERQERFRRMFQADFDTARIARFVLGPYWKTASPTEQQEFDELFENYVVLVYSTRLGDFSGESFKVKGWRSSEDGSIVSTDISTPGHAAPLRVDWRLIPADGSFKITDVIVEGISMMVTERSEFASVMRRNGGDISGLLALMREKTAGIVPTAQ